MIASKAWGHETRAKELSGQREQRWIPGPSSLRYFMPASSIEDLDFADLGNI